MNRETKSILAFAYQINIPIRSYLQWPKDASKERSRSPQLIGHLRFIMAKAKSERSRQALIHSLLTRKLNECYHSPPWVFSESSEAQPVHGSNDNRHWRPWFKASRIWLTAGFIFRKPWPTFFMQRWNWLGKGTFQTFHGCLMEIVAPMLEWVKVK
jgi:hypothetical protein